MLLVVMEPSEDLPVTPTMTKGWQAKKENNTEPSTDDKRTSLTPKLMAVLENISSEKASAGRTLLAIN